MKQWINRTSAYPKYARFFYWSKLLTITGSAQLTIQGIGLICGILVVRLLSPNQYALYTLSNTMLGTMILLSDGGISTGVISQAGKVWQDKRKLGIVMATGLALRRKFALWSLLVAVPLLFYFLLHHGAGWLMSILLVLAIIPAFFTSFSGTLLEIVPRLMQNIAQLQKIEVTVSVMRLILLSACMVFFPWAFVAILSAGLPQLWANKRLHVISADRAHIYEEPDPEVRDHIIKIVKRVFPGAVYYCLSGQITLWMISIFGTTTAIAKVGALGRIAMVLTLLTSVFNTLIIPRFARLPDDRILLLKRFFGILIVLLTLGVFAISIIYLFSSKLLWILGPNYSNLKTEFMLNVIGSYISLIAGLMFSLILSRGWTINPLIAIPLNMLIIVVVAMVVDVSTIKGVFTFNIIIQVVDVAMYLCYGLIKIFKKPMVELPTS